MNRVRPFVRYGVAAVVAITVLVVLTTLQQHSSSSAVAPERLTLAVPLQIASANVLVAMERALFAAQGLEVTLRPHTLGKFALQEAIDGTADLALAADMPFVLNVLRGEPLALVATLHASGEYNAIVARRDRGIAAPADLRGKTVGLPFGTSMEFFKDVLLLSHRVDPSEVRTIDLAPEDGARALTEGRVDAVGTFSPNSLRLAASLGERGIVFSDPAIYTMTFNLVGNAERVRLRAAVMARLLAALVDASDWVRAHPLEAQALVARRLELDPSEVAKVWRDSDFSVALTQSLLVSVEDQARWAIRRSGGDPSQAPNFLRHLDAEPLSAARRDLVTVIR